MSRNKQGMKAGRKERHQASQKALRERKRVRKQKAAIHGAMTEASRMKRSKKRGAPTSSRT